MDPTAEILNTLNGSVGIQKDFSHLKQWVVFSKIYLKQRRWRFKSLEGQKHKKKERLSEKILGDRLGFSHP